VHYIYDSSLSWLDTRASVDSSICVSGMRLYDRIIPLRHRKLSTEVLESNQDSELSYI
jgi:hypothetical protein